MTKRWEQLEDGRLRLTVSPDAGGPTSVFYGSSKEEIADKLADSQAHANMELSRRTVVPNGNHQITPQIQPVPLSPADRMQITADLVNPARAPEAVTRVLESVIGPVGQFNQDREAERSQRLERAQVAAAYQFYEEAGPEWLPTQHNKETLLNYMLSQGMDLTDVNSYKRAFAALGAVKLLQQPTTETHDTEEPEVSLHRGNPENPVPARAPNRYSTGIRSSDVSGSAPMPGKRLKYTREQIAALSLADYKRLINDPEFSRSVEFYSKRAQKRVAV